MGKKVWISLGHWIPVFSHWSIRDPHVMELFEFCLLDLKSSGLSFPFACQNAHYMLSYLYGSLGTSNYFFFFTKMILVWRLKRHHFGLQILILHTMLLSLLDWKQLYKKKKLTYIYKKKGRIWQVGLLAKTTCIKHHYIFLLNVVI